MIKLIFRKHMAHSRLECPYKSWTGLGLNHLPGWVAPAPRPDHRPLLLPLLLLVPAHWLHCLLLLHIVVLLVVPLFPLWFWAHLLHLLVAMKVSKETLTCFFVSSRPHLLAAPSTWQFDPSTAPPVLKIPRSFSLSSIALESTVEVVGLADSNTLAFCGHWNVVGPSFLTSKLFVAVVFFSSDAIVAFSSFSCIMDWISSCLFLACSTRRCRPSSGSM